MSDAKLRELERRWRESGAAEDEAAYLQERVRLGDLGRDRLEIAALCGSAAARLVLGSTVSPASDPVLWVRGIGDRDIDLAIRAAVAAARQTYPMWRAHFAAPAQGEWVAAAIDAAERGVSTPTEENRARAEDAAECVQDALFETGGRASHQGRLAAQAARWAALAAAERNVAHAVEAVRVAVEAMGTRASELQRTVGDAVAHHALHTYVTGP